MSIFVNENGELVRKDTSAASQLIAVDTDNILGGGAGAQTNSQAMFDELSDRAIALNSSLSDDEEQINAIVNVYGSKNLLDYLGSYDYGNGGTTTVSGKNITSVCTDSSSIYPFVRWKRDAIPAGTYKFKYTVVSNANSTARYIVRNASTNTNIVTKSVSTTAGTYTDTITSDVPFIIILYTRYGSAATAANITLTNMMIMDSRIKDDSYVDFAPTNRDCMSYAVNSKLGAHNLLPFNVTTQTTVSVTLSVDSTNNIVTANGTSNGGSVIEIGRMLCKAGVRYKLRGVNNNTTTLSERKMLLRVGKLASATESGNGTYDQTASYDGILTTYGNRTGDICYSTDQWITVGMEIASGKVFSNFLVKPQVTLMSDTDDTYAPYAMTNRELTEVKNVTNGFTALSDATINSYTTLVQKNGKHIHGVIRLTTPSTVTNNAAVVQLSAEVTPNHINEYPLGVAFAAWGPAGECMTYVSGGKICLSGNSWTASKDVMIFLDYFTK